MELKLLNGNDQAAGKVDAPDTIFGRDYNEALIHQLVVAFQANARTADSQQKNRETVAHTTKKPWRRKARVVPAPVCLPPLLWRGGGRAFPNSPDQNFSHKVNKKMYRAGVCSFVPACTRRQTDPLSISWQLTRQKRKCWLRN